MIAALDYVKDDDEGRGKVTHFLCEVKKNTKMLRAVCPAGTEWRNEMLMKIILTVLYTRLLAVRG